MTMDNGTDAPLPRTGDYSESWFVYGLGASLRFGNAANARRANIFYLNVERSTGGYVEQEWFYNAGFRFMM